MGIQGFFLASSGTMLPWPGTQGDCGQDALLEVGPLGRRMWVCNSEAFCQTPACWGCNHFQQSTEICASPCTLTAMPACNRSLCQPERHTCHQCSRHLRFSHQERGWVSFVSSGTICFFLSWKRKGIETPVLTLCFFILSPTALWPCYWFVGVLYIW